MGPWNVNMNRLQWIWVCAKWTMVTTVVVILVAFAAMQGWRKAGHDHLILNGTLITAPKCWVALSGETPRFFKLPCLPFTGSSGSTIYISTVRDTSPEQWLATMRQYISVNSMDLTPPGSTDHSRTCVRIKIDTPDWIDERCLVGMKSMEIRYSGSRADYAAFRSVLEQTSR